jgi:PPOX class probable F420-dependent enzyme
VSPAITTLPRCAFSELFSFCGGRVRGRAVDGPGPAEAHRPAATVPGEVVRDGTTEGDAMALDEELRTFATAGNFAALTTLFADGSPQTQVMWVDADDEHILINTEVHRAKFRNVERDPRVTVTIWQHDDPYRYVEVRGEVTDIVRGPAAREHIDRCAHRYFGRPYPGEQIASERAILLITPTRILRRGV